MYDISERWHPAGERLLRRPEVQDHKRSRASGDRVPRYERNLKRGLVREFRGLLSERLPYCAVRYAFQTPLSPRPRETSWSLQRNYL